MLGYAIYLTVLNVALIGAKSITQNWKHNHQITNFHLFITLQTFAFFLIDYSIFPGISRYVIIVASCLMYLVLMVALQIIRLRKGLEKAKS